MMANAGNNNERGTQRGGSLLDKIKSWDEAMHWSERYVKSESDGPVSRRADSIVEASTPALENW